MVMKDVVRNVEPVLQEDLGGKATNEELSTAIGHLKAAGFPAREIGVYILAGLPDQDVEGIEASLRFVHAAGGLSRLGLTKSAVFL